MTQPARRDVPAFCTDTSSASRTDGEPRSAGNIVDGFLKSPFAGIAPWALLSVLSAPGRFEIAVASALAMSVLVMLVGVVRGIRVHLLEVFGAMFFAGVAVVGLLATDCVLRFLELWVGELTNISLALFAWFSVLIRRPFTMAYAKDTTPQEYWDTQLFKRINTMISAAWAGTFTFAATVGFIGDYLLHDAGNFWTGWILQLAAIFFAAAFTEFYPDYATARLDLADGKPARVPSIAKLVDWLPMFLVITGIAGLVTDSVNLAVGVALIVVGSVASGLAAKLAPSTG